MSEYIPKELVEKAKSLTLLEYLNTYFPEEVVKKSNGTYTTKTHDSLIMSNGLWHRFSNNTGGKSAIDYFCKNGYSFKEAVKHILETMNANTNIEVSSLFQYDKNNNDLIKKEIVVPKRNENNIKVIDYLMSRGIDEEIINYCIINNLIYQEKGTEKVVFVGYDNDKNIKYCMLRATNNSRDMKDASGSSKEYSFRLLCDNSTSLHLFESAIDLLSYATLIKQSGFNFRNQNMISLSGVYQTSKDIAQSKVPIAIESYLKDNNIKDIILHFDNDKPGKNATKAFKLLLSDKYEVRDIPAPIGKDINDYLCYKVGLKNRNEIEKYKQKEEQSRT